MCLVATVCTSELTERSLCKNACTLYSLRRADVWMDGHYQTYNLSATQSIEHIVTVQARWVLSQSGFHRATWTTLGNQVLPPTELMRVAYPSCVGLLESPSLRHAINTPWIFLYFQDADASYDVNGHDPDPQPRYDYTNENRYF